MDLIPPVLRSFLRHLPEAFEKTAVEEGRSERPWSALGAERLVFPLGVGAGAGLMRALGSSGASPALMGAVPPALLLLAMAAAHKAREKGERRRTERWMLERHKRKTFPRIGQGGF